MSLNRVTLMGHLGRDPEVRYSSRTGAKMVTLSLATSSPRWTDKDTGEIHEEMVQWHRVLMLGRAADVADKYLRKGSQAYIEGQLSYRKYTDKEGIERYVTDIRSFDLQLLGSKPSDAVAAGEASPTDSGGAAQSQPVVPEPNPEPSVPAVDSDPADSDGAAPATQSAPSVQASAVLDAVQSSLMVPESSMTAAPESDPELSSTPKKLSRRKQVPMVPESNPADTGSDDIPY